MLAGSCRLPLPALCPPSQDHNVIEAQSKASSSSSSSSSSASSSASTSSPSHGWDNIRKALRSGDAIKVAAALGAEGGTFSLAECRLLRAACGVMERTAMEASMQEAEKNLAAHDAILPYDIAPELLLSVMSFVPARCVFYRALLLNQGVLLGFIRRPPYACAPPHTLTRSLAPARVHYGCDLVLTPRVV